MWNYKKLAFEILLFDKVALRAKIVKGLWKLKSNFKMRSFRITFGLSLAYNFFSLNLAFKSNHIYLRYVIADIILSSQNYVRLTSDLFFALTFVPLMKNLEKNLKIENANQSLMPKKVTRIAYIS